TFYVSSVDPARLVTGTNVLAVEVHQSSGGSSDISFALELIGSTGTTSATLTRGPYLQMGTPTGAVVRWRTGAPSDARVRYGTDPANLSAFADVTGLSTEHEVALSGLQPNTKYYYSVGTTSAVLAGGDANHFF